MQPRILLAQVTQHQIPQNSQQSQSDPVWASVGQYGVGAAALLAILKMYADYQLKAAIEDRAMKVKESQQGLELEGRVFSSLLSQQENSVTSTGALLNTFIAKTLNQAETQNEQTSSLIETIGTLTNAIKFLGDTQQAQTAILYEIKEYSEAHSAELLSLALFRTEILSSVEMINNLVNQTLAILERLVESSAYTNINRGG